MNTDKFLSPNDVIFKDFLLNLNDEPTTENMKRLTERIEELETKLVEQTKLNQQRELEFHRIADEKKGKWILKYLETKMQLESTRNFYQDGKKLWHQDLKNLFSAIKFLLKKTKEKDNQTLEILKDVERDLTSVVQASLNLSHSQHKMETSRTPRSEMVNLEDGLTIGHNPLQDSDPKLSTGEKRVIEEMASPKPRPLDISNISPKGFGKCEIPVKTLRLDESNGFSLGSSGDILIKQELAKNDFNDFFSPKANPAGKKLVLDHVKLAHFNDPIISTNRSTNATFSSSISNMLSTTQKKIKSYIFEVNQIIAHQQIKFPSEINETLKKVHMILQGEDHNLSFNGKELSKEMKIILNNERSRSPNAGFHSYYSGVDKQSILQIIDNNTSPKNFSTSINNSKLRSQEKSMKMLNKMLKGDDPKKSIMGLQNNNNQQIMKLFEDLQASLSLSEREAILFTLMNKEEDEKPMNDVKLDDLLAISTNPNKIGYSSISLVPPSNNKRKSLNRSNVAEIKANNPYLRSIPDEKLNETMRASTLRSHNQSCVSLDGDEASQSFHLKEELKMSDLKSMKNQVSPPFEFGMSTIQKPNGKSNPKNKMNHGSTALRDKILKENISPILPKAEGQKINKKIDFEDSSVLEESKKFTGKLTFSDKSIDIIDDKLQSNRVANFSTDITKMHQITEVSPEGKETISMVANSSSGKPPLQTAKKKKSVFCFCATNKKV